MFANYLWPDGRISTQLVCVLNMMHLTSAVLTSETKAHYGLVASEGHYVATGEYIGGKSGKQYDPRKWVVLRKG